MIRPATVDDIRPIYDMMEAYFREAIDKRHYPLKWEEERAVIYLGNLLWKDTGLNFIAEHGEGMILGEMMTTWFGDNLMGSPAALYVKPEHRNGLIARALIRRFETAVIAAGGIAVSWDFWAGVSDNGMIDGMMKALGYKFHGCIYRKIFSEVDHGSTCTYPNERGRQLSE